MLKINFARRLRGTALLAASLVLATGLATGSSKAETTIADIMNAKKVVIGINQDFPPFAFINDKQEPDGLNVDLARLVAKYLGVEVEIKQVASANRIPYLLTKQVDFLVASLGVTPERAKQVMFTIPYASTYTEIVASKDKAITGLPNLSNVKIAVGRGSSNDLFMTQLAPKDANIMRFEGEAAAAQALLSGQVDVLAGSNTMTAGIMRDNAALNLESKFVVRSQYDAMTVRKEDTELHAWLNALIFYIKTDGELNDMYQKWFGSPLPDMPSF